MSLYCLQDVFEDDESIHLVMQVCGSLHDSLALQLAGTVPT